MGKRTEQIIIAVKNCLISIKIALDRLIKIIRLYEVGIAEYTTFGHIDEKTNKAKGFMAQVVEIRKRMKSYDTFIENMTNGLESV